MFTLPKVFISPSRNLKYPIDPFAQLYADWVVDDRVLLKKDDHWQWVLPEVCSVVAQHSYTPSPTPFSQLFAEWGNERVDRGKEERAEDKIQRDKLPVFNVAQHERRGGQAQKPPAKFISRKIHTLQETPSARFKKHHCPFYVTEESWVDVETDTDSDSDYIFSCDGSDELEREWVWCSKPRPELDNGVELEDYSDLIKRFCMGLNLKKKKKCVLAES